MGIVTEDASSPADGMKVEYSAIMEESMALLIKSSSWMVPSSSWKVEMPMWALVSIAISLDLDMKLPKEREGVSVFGKRRKGVCVWCRY